MTVEEMQRTKDAMFNDLVAKIGPSLTSDFYVGIARVKDECKNLHARVYVEALLHSYEEGGLHGVKVQLLYVLSNTQYWRGAEARKAKAELKGVIGALEEAGF